MIKPKFWLALPVILFLLPIISTAQQQTGLENNAIISTERLLKDSAAITHQLQRADAIAETNADSAIKLSLHAAESSRQLHYNLGVAGSLYNVGFLHYTRGNYPLAISILRSAIPYCDSNKPKANEIRLKLYSLLAEVYQYYGKTDSTAYYSYQMLDDIERLHINSPYILLETYSKVIGLWLNLNDSPVDFANDKYMQNAANYLNKAEQLGTNNKEFKTQIVFGKGQLKQLLKDFDSARYFYREMFFLVKQGSMEGRTNSWASATLINISDLFLQEKKADSAIWYAKAALKELPANGGNEFMHYIFANYYIGKAYCLQKKYKEAIATTAPALEIAKRNKMLFLRDMAHETLAEAYRETGSFEKALEQQTAYSMVKDSMMRVGKIQAISQMEMKYKVAEKNKLLTEQELTIVKKDNHIKSKNFWIAAIAAGFILVTAIGFAGFLRNRHRQQIIALQNRQQLEITRLQATISGEENERQRLARELHDGIGGQLGAMRLQLDTALHKNAVEDNHGDFANLQQQLNDTYTELRKTAHNLMPETLIEEGLAKALSMFCAGIGNGTGIEMVFETVGDMPRLAPTEELALYRMVQELVHNIIKHAKASQAMVQLAYDGNMLGITVEDNGTGIVEKTDKLLGGKGLGLVAIQERIKAMGGQMDIFSQPGKGTSINIELYPQIGML